MDSTAPRARPQGQTARYPIAWRVATGLAHSILTRRRRSFVRDARIAISALRPTPDVINGEHVPPRGPLLVVCNHYTRPGLQAWWLVFAITAALVEHRALGDEEEVAWVMTAAWRFENSRWRHRFLTPFSHLVFSQIANAYGFVTMPPMPPLPEETHERAAAVLRTVRLARRLASTGGLLCLAPEGRDTLTGPAEPPPGAGDFITLLVETGMPVLPAAVTEMDGRLRISFGPPFMPDIPADRTARDDAVVGQVMDTIKRLLP